MKKMLCILFVFCLFAGTLSLSGCSTSEELGTEIVGQMKLALISKTELGFAQRNEERSLKHEWEPLYPTAVYGSTTLDISRRHVSGFLRLHRTEFKVTAYEFGTCTSCYIISVPCEKGFLCDGEPASFKAAAEYDEKLGSLYPYSQAIAANKLVEEMINSGMSDEQMKQLVANDNLVLDWAESLQDDAFSEMSSGVLDGLIEGNDFLSKAVEIHSTCKDADDAIENSQSLEDFLNSASPETQKMINSYNNMLNLLYGYDVKANSILKYTAGEYTLEDLDKGYVAVLTDELEKNLILTNYGIEEYFVSEYGTETMLIYRYHTQLTPHFHYTQFDIQLSDSNDPSAHYYSKTAFIPCKNGFLKCRGRLADFADGAELSPVIAQLSPYLDAAMRTNGEAQIKALHDAFKSIKG